MKLNENIRIKRKELGMTQQQVADYLGVSVPAVNKWEKGSSCPDIMLLPPLARLLKSDLNELMGYHDNLSEIEVTRFAQSLYKKLEESADARDVIQEALDKIREFPNSGLLALQGMYLVQTAMFLYSLDRSEYFPIFEKLANRLLQGEDEDFRHQAASVLIMHYLSDNEIGKAQSLMDMFPDSHFDKDQHQVQVYLAEEKYQEAETLLHTRVLSNSADLQVTLQSMINALSRQGKYKEAHEFAKIYEKIVMIFLQTEFAAQTGYLTIAMIQKDAVKSIELLTFMLESMKQKKRDAGLDLMKKLYGTQDQEVYYEVLIAPTLNSIQTEAEWEFLRDHPDYQKLLDKFKGGI